MHFHPQLIEKLFHAYFKADAMLKMVVVSIGVIFIQSGMNSALVKLVMN